MTSKVLLIDGDIVAYRAAAVCDGRQYALRYMREGQAVTLFEEYKKDADILKKSLETEGFPCTLDLEFDPEPEKNAKYLITKIVHGIKMDCEEHYGCKISLQFFLSIEGSFREQEFPEYKSNRKDLRRPHHLNAMKDYLVSKYGAKSKPGLLEADDMMAMGQGEDTVICSIDKDLLQVPGHHFNFVKKIFSEVTEEQGNRSLYSQMLTGDATDGIPGIKGVGAVTAKKLLKDVHSPFMMYCVVLKEYLQRHKPEEGETQEDFQSRMIATVRVHARLLYLLRSEDDGWEAPTQEDHANR